MRNRFLISSLLCVTIVVVLLFACSMSAFAERDLSWVINQNYYGNTTYDVYYTASDGVHTIRSSGCGLCAIVNAVRYLTGNAIDVHDVATYAREHNEYVVGSGTKLSLYQNYADAYGELYGFSYKTKTTSLADVKKYLQDGNVIIVTAGRVNPSGGHVMVLADYDANTNRFLILDSAGSASGTYAWSNSGSSCYSWQQISDTKRLSRNDRVTLSSFFVYELCEYIDLEPPVVKNVQITNVSNTGYTITCNVSDNVAVSRVAFPTWTDSNWQDDIVWQDGVINNGTASFRVKASDHGNQVGRYLSYIYAYDASGNCSEEKRTYVDVPMPGTEALVINNVSISDLSASGYTITCNYPENVGIVRVAFPTWTDANWQDDIIWRDGTISNGTASFRVNTSEHMMQSGRYLTYIYAFDAAGNSSSEMRLYIDVPHPITNVTVSDVCDAGYTITCNYDTNIGITRIAFPTWTDADWQDDIVWQDGTLADGFAFFHVNTKNHHNQSGRYLTYIYAYDESGNCSEETRSYIDVPLPGMKALVISNVVITDLSPSGYTVTCNYPENVGVVSVAFPTWTDSDWQDDIIWKAGTMVNGTASFRVNTSEHMLQSGRYLTYIYAFDDAGNSSEEMREYIDVPHPISDVSISDVSETGYTVSCKYDINVGIVRIAFPTWTDEDWQDDIIWQDGILNNGVATYRVNTAEHGKQAGRYLTYIYAYDEHNYSTVENSDTRLFIDVPGRFDVAELVLPVSLKTICEGAFANSTVSAIKCNGNLKEIKALAFENCAGLTRIYIPESVTSISDTAFEGCQSSLTIYGKKNSEAQSFAQRKGFRFIVVAD